MWEWTLNWDQVRDDLVLGSCPMTTSDIDRIHRESGVTALLSLQSDACRRAFGIDYAEHQAHAAREGLILINAPMLDFDPPDQRRNLPSAVRSLHRLLAAGHKVYLHCTAGCNRGPLTALGYLTFVEMQAPEAAISMICQARPAAAPSWEAYEGCRQDLVEMLREHIVVRAYYLSQERPELDASAHWLRAESEILRDAFVRERGPARWRRDPSRAEEAFAGAV
jgi:protein-tyrosine phosphatase